MKHELANRLRANGWWFLVHGQARCTITGPSLGHEPLPMKHNAWNIRLTDAWIHIHSIAGQFSIYTASWESSGKQIDDSEREFEMPARTVAELQQKAKKARLQKNPNQAKWCHYSCKPKTENLTIHAHNVDEKRGNWRIVHTPADVYAFRLLSLDPRQPHVIQVCCSLHEEHPAQKFQTIDSKTFTSN